MDLVVLILHLGKVGGGTKGQDSLERASVLLASVKKNS